jgi:hypothetical protein
MSDAKQEGYADLVAEAEAAVSGVKDPELRRVAFEKILETLLAKPSSRPKKPQRKGSKVKTATPKTSGGKKVTRRAGPKARVVELVDEGFFAKQRTIADVKAELANRGYHIPITSLSGPLQSLTRERRLRRQKSTRAGKNSKGIYAYSNW